VEIKTDFRLDLTVLEINCVTNVVVVCFCLKVFMLSHVIEKACLDKTLSFENFPFLILANSVCA
jgi:hypothetical protein